MNQTRNSRDTGVAIVGVAGRFPGARNIREFWNNLAAGVESIHFSSAEELLSAGIDSKVAQQPGYIPASSTIEQPEFFDASFFGFSAREAEVIDPQQRVFLECAWEALEDAGCDPSTYPGPIGVFAGAGMNTYALLNLFSNPKIIESVGSYQAMIGNDKDFLSSRVAYKLNLRGPAVGVQTACSTSLVAVQMAFESLLRDECDVALAGGVSIPLPQSPGYTYVPGMILSRDGHCRAFDAEASGTVPGAGAGIVVLKRLNDALKEGDQIYAVIRGAAVNNDGSAKVGYTAPSVAGQSAVVRRSMEMAGFSPESVAYVEAHGTGTEVGDPIEVTALTQAFSSACQRPDSCVIGALKTNLGHLDTAAGVAGLIKTALAVRNRLVPPTLHFSRPNPLIDFSKTPFYVSSSPVAYASPEPFRAGVSSFGIGGTNAHVSLEEAPASKSDPAVGPQLIVLSAKSSSALDHMSDRLAEFVDSEPGTNLADLAFTLQRGRQAFQHRRVLVVDDTDRLASALRRPEQSGPQQQMKTGDAPNTPPRIIFLFPGQGSQYVNMGQGLYRTSPVYRDAVDRCADLLQPHLALDLRKLLHPEPADQAEAERLLSRTEYTQPALFAVEYAVAKLWMDCGISPSAMLGHSVGEYVAACLAGVFSLEDALALIAARGKMIQGTPAGAMLAVGLPELDLEPLLTPKISIAAENSPGQTVASGEEPAIAELESRLRSRKIECRRLRTSHAFHSPMMDAVVGKFTERVAQVRLHAPRLPYLSNVTGTWITDAQATDPHYWASHLRGTVRFMDCGRRLLEQPKDVLLEAGPGDTLLSLLRTQLPPRSTRPMISSMRRAGAGEDDREHWLTAVGRLWLLSAPIDWDGLHRGERRSRVSLPTYPFERQRYWIEPKPLAVAPESAPAVPRKEPDIADWFYVPSWTRSASELLPASTVADTDTWLVFATDDPALHPMIEGLRARGSVVTVNPGAAFSQISSTQYELDPANREDYARLLNHLQGSGQWPDRIVHAWTFNSNRDSSRDRMLDLTVFSAMFLVQAVEECSATRPVELNVVSERGYSVMGEQIFATAGAALNAFCGVAALECPNITCRTIDMDFQSDRARAARQVVIELFSPAVNELVAYRGTARWVQQYTPIRVEAARVAGSASRHGSIALRTGGTYLITGGLGGIGLVLARHLASSAGATIILTSRTPLPERSAWPLLLESTATSEGVQRRIEGVLSIEAAGGRVVSVSVDTVDTAGMRRTLETIRADLGPVHGIIHAAGIAGAGMIQAKHREQANAVIAPKVQGIEWIRETLGSADLDFVMLCSSISAVLPSYGLADYSAANAYLDSFANVFDDPSGTRVLSVGWDTWGEVGMAVDIQLPGAFALRRKEELKHALTSAEAEEVFDRVLNAPVPQILISTRNVDALERLTAQAAAQIKAGSSLHAPAATVAHSRPESLEDFAAAGDDVEQFIVNVWQELLGVEPIGINDDFFSLGGHSLLGTQVLARMRDRFQVELTLRTIFEASTPAQLAQHVRTLSWASGAATVGEPVEREEIEI